MHSGKPDQKRELPACFVQFNDTLTMLDKLQLSPTQMLEQQQQCLATFYAEYFIMIRVTQQHIFQFVIRKALGLLKVRCIVLSSACWLTLLSRL